LIPFSTDFIIAKLLRKQRLFQKPSLRISIQNMCTKSNWSIDHYFPNMEDIQCHFIVQ